MDIFLDDVRDPPYRDREDEQWVVVRTAKAFKQLFEQLEQRKERPRIVSFDHDLGMDQANYDRKRNRFLNSYDMIQWIAEHHPRIYPGEVYVHSANPVGSRQIREFDRLWRERGEQ